MLLGYCVYNFEEIQFWNKAVTMEKVKGCEYFLDAL